MDSTTVIEQVGVGAVIMPPIVALINQAHWKAPVKAIVALLVCLAGAAVWQWWQHGPLSLSTWRESATVIALSAFAAYRVWWQPSRIAPAIENGTSTS